MKIAIPAAGNDVNGSLDPRFGRARYFLVADTETGAVEAHDNTQNLNAAQGAGIQAAQNVVNLGVAAVISGNVGPKAFQVLNAAGVKVYLCERATVSEAIRRFKAGELKEVDAANVAGHWM